MSNFTISRRTPTLTAMIIACIVLCCLTVANAADSNSCDVAFVEIIIYQLAAYQHSIETTIDIHLKWFAFACTINATVIGLILVERLRLRTPIIPLLFILGNVAGAVGSVFVIYHYCDCHDHIANLLRGFSQDLKPTTALGLLIFVGIAISLFCVLMAAGWIYVLIHWKEYRAGRGKPDITTQTEHVVAGN